MIVARPSLRDPLQLLACGLGAGLLPKMPGTWGTLVAVPVYLLLQHLSFAAYLGCVALSFVGGIWICSHTVHALGTEDHPSIVWDEMVGYWVTMMAAPRGALWMAVGFVLFRLFDIWKPWPIRWLDHNLRGGFGVMVDDLLAGLYAALVLSVWAYLDFHHRISP